MHYPNLMRLKHHKPFKAWDRRTSMLAHEAKARKLERERDTLRQQLSASEKENEQLRGRICKIIQKVIQTGAYNRMDCWKDQFSDSTLPHVVKEKESKQ
jgi:predicted RNase H-like nuclease (RuvC/YqgF family)